MFNGLRWIVRTGAQWPQSVMPNDLPPWYTVYQQARRWIAASVFEDMMHDLRALLRLAKGKKEQSSAAIFEVVFVDQGYTGDNPKNDAKDAGIDLIVVELPEAKKGFVLLPRRWVAERSFAWTARFRRLARDFERTPETFRAL